MIQKHIEKVLQDKEIIDKIICNCCGKPVHTAKDMCGNTMFIDCVQFKNNLINRQFGRTDFIANFDLCEDCFDKIISGFKIPIKKGDIFDLLQEK